MRKRVIVIFRKFWFLNNLCHCSKSFEKPMCAFYFHLKKKSKRIFSLFYYSRLWWVLGLYMYTYATYKVNWMWNSLEGVIKSECYLYAVNKNDKNISLCYVCTMLSAILYMCYMATRCLFILMFHKHMGAWENRYSACSQLVTSITAVLNNIRITTERATS